MTGSISLEAQNRSDFERVKSNRKYGVIYSGPCTFDDLAALKPFHLARQSRRYKPDSEKLAALADKLPAYTMIVFLGTWCTDSYELIPKLYRILNETNYPYDALQLYALDRNKAGKGGEEKPYHITRVPTIILLQDGAEKGRITETVTKDLETDLLRIIEAG